jgi:hypothetical protein
VLRKALRRRHRLLWHTGGLFSLSSLDTVSAWGEHRPGPWNGQGPGDAEEESSFGHHDSTFLHEGSPSWMWSITRAAPRPSPDNRTTGDDPRSIRNRIHDPGRRPIRSISSSSPRSSALRASGP